MSHTVESFSDMLRFALGDRLDAKASSFVEMFHPEGVMEFPYAYGDLPKRVEGRTALSEHLTRLARQISFDRMSLPEVTQTEDPDCFILEFEAFGSGVETGEPYEQRYISVIRLRDGYIVHYKDYWNPLAILRAVQGSDRVAALTGRGD